MAEEKEPAKKAAVGSWSDWFQGDNGLWFWQARLKPNGEWEYQFTHGYLTARRGPPLLPYDVKGQVAKGELTVPVAPIVGSLPNSTGRTTTTIATQRQVARSTAPSPRTSAMTVADSQEDESHTSEARNKTPPAQPPNPTEGATRRPKVRQSHSKKQKTRKAGRKVRGWLRGIGLVLEE